MRGSYYGKCIGILNDLHKKFPMYNMGRHLSTALDEWDIWGISDKELFLSLEKYLAELELDIPHIYNENIEKIIEDGIHLDRILDNGDEEDNIY